jgi:uncharacterized cupredoxin-like copper-binding protein
VSSATAPSSHATVTIVVTAREFSFTLSKRSVPVGTTVIFKVVNKGKITHNFAIGGKITKNLNPGQTTRLTVKFAKKGLVTYRCTIFGHAAAGMKGKFAVGGAAPPPPPTTTTTTTPTTTGTVGTGKTTVTVNMVEYAFQLSQTAVPSGQVTFVIHNSGVAVHNFDIEGVKVGALLAPGTSETWTVALAPGTYIYQCDVPFHAQRGMIANLTVTS